MKLGEIQRYVPDATGPLELGGKVFCRAHPDGDYVLFTDAQAKSLADERRIAELEAAIRDALNDSETGDGWGPDVTVAAKLRAALRVETQEKTDG